MTSERSLWHTAKRRLSPYGSLERIESPLVKGVPDVVYCLLSHTGWLELKELDAWPVRPLTPIRIPSLQLEQVLFMENWIRRPSFGSAFLLLQVERSYLLVDAVLTRKIFERKAVRTDLELNADVIGHHKFPTGEIVRVLTRGSHVSV